jgi:RNA polymerase sigma-70 factor (sigma-E family)
VTSTPPRMPPGQGIEEVARLVEESTLGTVGARQLRDRDADIAAVIRARAYFAGSHAGRSWWQVNQRNPDALRAMARELAARDSEISDALALLADRQAVAHPDGLAADPLADAAAEAGARPQVARARRGRAADWASFRDFHDREMRSLTAILCQQADLPASLGQKLIRRAMTEAFDDWENLAAAGDPGEWVLGRALQLYRAQRQPAAMYDVEFPEDTAPPGNLPVGCLPPTAIQRPDVRVTGALAAAASQIEVPATLSRPLEVESGTPVPPLQVTETLVADTALGPVPADWDADRAVTALYSTHYRSLVRLATLLVRDLSTAEEVVQDSFTAMHGGWRRFHDSEKALSYLRQSVVNRSRSVLRHRMVVDRNAPKPLPDIPSAEHGAIVLLERSAVVAALRTLHPRQREALVLRYYGDMTEAQIASIMGISRGAVKSHTARAMSALRSILEA